MSRVWLITGSGSGLGHDIAEVALASGDIVDACARKLEQLDDLMAQDAERVLPVLLDVRDEVQARRAVERAVERFGRVDVLVNNAGYGSFAPFEQLTPEQFRDIVETCFLEWSTPRAPCCRSCVSRSPALFSRLPPSAAA